MDCFVLFTVSQKQTRCAIVMLSRSIFTFIHLKLRHRLRLFLIQLSTFIDFSVRAAAAATEILHQITCRGHVQLHSSLMTNQLEQFFFPNTAHHPLPQMRTLDFTSQYGQHLEMTEHNVLQCVLYSFSIAPLWHFEVWQLTLTVCF